METTVLREIGFEEAKAIAGQKGLRPGRVRGTEQVRFTRGSNERIEVIDWTAFEATVQRRNLGIYESGGFMKLMRKH